MPGVITCLADHQLAQAEALATRLAKLKADADEWAQKGIDPPIRNDLGSNFQTFLDWASPDSLAHGLRVGGERIARDGPSRRKVAATVAGTGAGVGLGAGANLALGVAAATLAATGIGAAIALGLAITVGGALYLYNRYTKREEAEKKLAAGTDDARLDAFCLLLEHGRLDTLAHAFVKSIKAREKFFKTKTDRTWLSKVARPGSINCVDTVLMANGLCYWRKRLQDRLTEADDIVCLSDALLIVQHRAQHVEAVLETKGMELVTTCAGHLPEFTAALPASLGAARAGARSGLVTLPRDGLLDWDLFLHGNGIQGTAPAAKVLSCLILKARATSNSLPVLPHFDAAVRALARAQAAEASAPEVRHPTRTLEAARRPAASGLVRGIAGRVFNTLATKGVGSAVWVGPTAAHTVGMSVAAGAASGPAGAFLTPVFDMLGNWINDQVNMRYLAATPTSIATAGEKVKRLRTMLTTGRLAKMHESYRAAGLLCKKMEAADWNTTNPWDAATELYELQDHYLNILAAATLIEEVLLIIESQTAEMTREYNVENMAFWAVAERQNRTDHSQCRGTCYGPKPNHRDEECKHPLGA